MDVAWLLAHLGALGGRTVQHLELAGVALVVGFAISFALALVAIRRRALGPPITAVVSTVYTIPSLALFAALVPVTGISFLTAEVPLVLYTLVIFVRNITGGVAAVPAEVVEAADGMGFGRAARLWRVELPLALPLIVAGLRVASVSTVGLVTISGMLGDRFGGLGFFIFEGQARGFATEMLAGAVLSIALALLLDAAFVRLERLATPWARVRVGGVQDAARRAG